MGSMESHKQQFRNARESHFPFSLIPLIASCLTFIWDILKWLVLEWNLEENQTYPRLIIAKIGAMGAILFLLWIVVLAWTVILAAFVTAT